MTQLMNVTYVWVFTTLFKFAINNWEQWNIHLLCMISYGLFKDDVKQNQAIFEVLLPDVIKLAYPPSPVTPRFRYSQLWALKKGQCDNIKFTSFELQSIRTKQLPTSDNTQKISPFLYCLWILSAYGKITVYELEVYGSGGWIKI